MKKRVISLFLAILMVLSIFPAPTFAVDEETMSNSVVGCTATFNTSSVWLYTAPGVMSQIINTSFIPHVVITAVEGEYYRIDAAEGYTWPEGYEGAHYVKSVYLTLDKPETAIVDKNGNIINSLTMGQYDKPELTANAPFSTADVNYQWQIEYEKGKWVDIYGEDSKTVKLSYGMVATLLGDDGKVDIRCKTQAGSKVAYSKSITVTIEMYQPEEPDVVSESFVSSNGETVTVTVTGSLPEDATVQLGQTDSTGVDVKPGETVVAALDISIKNADGSEWQPESGEIVTVTLEASKLGLKNDDEFVVYHLHNDEVKVLGSYKVVDDTVSFDVDGFSKFVFALTEQTLFSNDLEDNVGKVATPRYSYFQIINNHPALAHSGPTVMEGTDYTAGIEFVISSVYISSNYPYNIYYEVEIKSGEIYSDQFGSTLWIYQGYQGEDPSVGTLIIHEPPVSEDPVYVTVDGKPVTEVALSTGNKVTITANTILANNIAYKWQLYISDMDMWVNISGQTKENLTLSVSMVNDYTDANGIAYVRCITTAGGESYTSELITVKVIETVSTFAFRRNSSMPLYAAGVATEYVVTVLRQYENGKIAAATWSAQQIAGSTETYKLILPDVMGYVPWIDTDGDGFVDAEAPKDSDGKYIHEFTVSNISANVEIKVIYKPGLVNYTVIYMFQNVYDDGYSPYGDAVIMSGYTNDPINVDELKQSFTGMNFFSYESDDTTIASDGSTVIYMHYDRTYYLMTFDLAGGQGVEPIFARYGTPLSINNPTRYGYTFAGWSDGNGNKVNLPAAMPAARTRYVATWSPEKVSFVVVFWYENADPDKDGTYGYTYVDHQPITGITAGATVNSASYQNYGFEGRDDAHFTYNASKGETITVAGDGSSVLNVYFMRNSYTLTFRADGKCVLPTHTHGDDCYTLGCGLEEHAHTNCGKSDTTVCGKAEHTEHTDACLICNTQEHDHEAEGCQWFFGWLCGKSEHTHSDVNGCYKDSFHTHTDACYSYTCGKVAHAHNADCNVLTCTHIAHHHGSNCSNSNQENVVKVVTRKYDADIRDIWPIVDDNGVKYEEYKWKSNLTGDYYAFLAKVPGENITLTESGNSGTKKTWYYYLEILPGQNTTGLTIREATKDGVTRTYYEWFSSVAHNVGNLTYAEDYFPITGFDQRDSNVPSFNNNIAYLYYTRNVHTLTFYNYNGDDHVYGSIPFETNLGKYNYIPDNPAERPEGAYEFKGWYLTPECVKGTEVDLSKLTMPDGDLTVYAKWQPIEHTVKVFDGANLSNQIGNPHTVLHGDTFATNRDGYTYDPTVFKNPPQKPAGKEDYEFVYWFYMDNGVEKTFDYESTPITKDMDIYAKWMTKAYGAYFVYYKLGNVDGPDVAEPTVAEAIVGVTKTFEAKIEGNLYPQYQNGYFPDKPSTSITIEEDSSENIRYFVYTEMPAVPYTVHYYDAVTKQPLVIDGVAVESKVVSNNRHAVVVEDYKQIPGYVPDTMQNRLVLSTDSSKNVIIFYYTKDDINAPFQESHYIQSIGGSYNDGTNGTLDDPYKSNQAILPIGTFKEASKLTIPGFKFDPNNVNNVTNGTVNTSGLKLKLYYTRNSYPYIIRHVKAGTNVDVALPENGSGLFESQFTGYPKTDIPGYRCVTANPVTKVINIESGTTPIINVIAFEYEEIPASIDYVMISPNGNTFTADQSWGKLSSYSENVGMMTGFVNGSTATVTNNAYKFVGWYRDAECESFLSDSVTYIPTKDNNALWVDGTTYYAKFEYNLTRVTIDKAFPVGVDYSMDVNQSFLFDVVEVDENGNIVQNGVDLTVTIHQDGSVRIDGLTVGHRYRITEKTAWSWRYSKCTPSSTLAGSQVSGNSITVKLSADAAANKVTFTNERSNEKWLDGDSWCNNIFN